MASSNSSNNVIFRIKELDPDMIAPSTKNMNRPEQGGSKIVIIGKPGCFIKGTPIMMYDGTSRPVETIKEGELVMGDDSTPRTVLELCRGMENMYKIQPLHDGMAYIVNETHKLVLRQISTKDIVEIEVKEYLEKDDSWKAMYRIYRNSVEFKEQPVTREPYEMGKLVAKDGTRVPSNYMYNTRQVRIEFLKGFFAENGPNYEQSSSSQLVQDINFMRVSLGTYWSDYEDEFTVSFMCYDMYYGFTLNGNHRFLLQSGDVVRNTGKTTMITSILYEKSHIFPVGQVMSGTEDSNGHYGKIFPSTFVYNALEKSKIEDFIKRQKLAKQHLPNPWAILLLDDCTDDPKLFTDPMFQGIFKNGRHWKMLFLLSLQYSLDIKPVIRTNVDGTFILRESNLRNRRCLWENYAGVFPDFDQFCQVLDQITDDYTALYVHNATTSNKIEDCVFWYKAKPIPPEFRIGCNEFWEFHNERYDSQKEF
jgi:Hom_end-associated Hint